MKGTLIGWILGKIAKLPQTKLEQYVELSLRVTSDRPRRPVDAILFFGRAKGDDEGLFDFVASLMHNGVAKNLVLNGSNGERHGGTTPGESWPGCKEWSRKLEERDVENIHYCKPALNTGDEAQKMLQYCLTQNWKSVVIVAWPHQLVRCFLSMVEAMNRLQQPIMVYHACPEKCDWEEDVPGSQGMNKMPRHLHIQLEYSRIHQYMNKGVASVEKGLEYFKAREHL